MCPNEWLNDGMRIYEFSDVLSSGLRFHGIWEICDGQTDQALNRDAWTLLEMLLFTDVSSSTVVNWVEYRQPIKGAESPKLMAPPP